jgi:hypothetical protein
MTINNKYFYDSLKLLVCRETFFIEMWKFFNESDENVSGFDILQPNENISLHPKIK